MFLCVCLCVSVCKEGVLVRVDVCIISVLCLEAMQVFTGAVYVYIIIMKGSKDAAGERG